MMIAELKEIVTGKRTFSFPLLFREKITSRYDLEWKFKNLPRVFDGGSKQEIIYPREMIENEKPMIFITTEDATILDYYAITMSCIIDENSTFLMWFVSDLVAHQIDYKKKELLAMYAQDVVSHQFPTEKIQRHGQIVLCVFQYRRKSVKFEDLKIADRTLFDIEKELIEKKKLELVAVGSFKVIFNPTV